MKSQTTIEALLVLTAYVAFLTALISAQGKLLTESKQIVQDTLGVLEEKHACAFITLFSNDGRNALTEFSRNAVNCSASRASLELGVEQNAFEQV